jgi:hypothetical protein
MTKTPKTKAPKTESLGAGAAPTTSRPGGKLGALVGLLGRTDGARIDEMIAATGWQAHSVRGAISGSLKKKLGLTITSDKTEAGRVYRIPAEAKA